MKAELTRRHLITGAVAAIAAAPSIASAHTRLHRIHATAHSHERSLSLVNVHTRETASLTYWKHGHYVPGAMHHIAHFMRDYRTGDIHHIDPKLLDLLHDLKVTLHDSQPYHLISGYRSPKTNAILAAMHDGVASGSLHMKGMAADVQMPGRSLESLHNAALHLARGGVGYYPRSDFVHVDTGRVRRWSYG